MNLNDLRDNLDCSINISTNISIKDLKISKLHKSNYIVKDIVFNLGIINLSKKNQFILSKLKRNKNTDSIFKKRIKKNINLVNKKKIDYNLINKINLNKNKSKNNNKNNNIKFFFIIMYKNFLLISNTILYFIRKSFIFILILSLIIFICKSSIDYYINSGFKKIINLKNNLSDLESIKLQINDSKFDFIIGDILFKPFMLIPNNNIHNGYHIIKGGKYLTKILDNLVHLYTELDLFINSKGIDGIYLTNLLFNIRNEFTSTEILLSNTLDHFNKINNLGDSNLDKKLNYGINNLNLLLGYLKVINKNYMTFLNLLGHNSERNYLIMFQNNDEIRPTGGFAGSMGLLKLKNGKIEKFIMTDIYANEWEINKSYTNKLEAPKGINKITGTFGLRDANYFPEFSKSSKSINNFYKRINRNIDGIIYINQGIIKELLKEIGGVEFEKINKTITEDNFSYLISTLVETKVFKKGTLGSPKQILFDFSNLFIDKLLKSKKYFTYLEILYKNILSRDIVLYSFIPEENFLLWNLGINGMINYSKNLDFNYPVFTSISGNKSDRYIKRKFKKTVSLNDDCSINTKLDISQFHNFTLNDEKNILSILNNYNIDEKNHFLHIQGKGHNNQYLRILIPKNSIIKESNNYDIVTNDNYKEIQLFTETKTFESSLNSIEYLLINKQCRKYNYYFYKQPGINNYDIELIINGESKITNNLNSDFKYGK